MPSTTATREHNETSPLLRKTPSVDVNSTSTRGSDDEGEGPASIQNGEDNSMAVMQIFSLCCAAVTEPVACFCIFPFISEMIQRTGGLAEADVGFWAGAIESLFSVVQMAFMLFYGRMLDRFGRKPVLVFSLAGLSFSTMLFGLSRTLWQMALVRCLAGSFAGSVLTVRVMVAESCNKATEAKAFAWFMFARNIGILLGPVVGGGLADPKLTRGSGFFKENPYFLATLGTGLVCLTGTMLVLVFARETLVKNKDTSSANEPMSISELLRIRGVLRALLIFGYTMVLALANTAGKQILSSDSVARWTLTWAYLACIVLPVFLFTSIDKGGFEFSPQWISYFLAGLAACQGLWTLAVFPAISRRLGNHMVMRLCTGGWPLLFACFPILNELSRQGWNIAFWATIPLPLIIGGFVAISFVSAQLLVNASCPSSNDLALINALTQVVNSAVRSVTPAIFTSIFAAGTKRQLADGHLCWVILIAASLPLNGALWRMPSTGQPPAR